MSLDRVPLPRVINRHKRHTAMCTWRIQGCATEYSTSIPQTYRVHRSCQTDQESCMAEYTFSDSAPEKCPPPYDQEYPPVRG